jgi:acyl carrier protein
MTKSEFHALLDEMLELDPGSAQPGSQFRDLPGWDSMAVLNFIALMDEQFGVSILPKDLTKCKSVDDLANLASGRIES